MKKAQLTPTFKHQPPKEPQSIQLHPAKVLDAQDRITKNGARLPVIMTVLALLKVPFPRNSPEPGKAGFQSP